MTTQHLDPTVADFYDAWQRCQQKPEHPAILAALERAKAALEESIRRSIAELNAIDLVEKRVGVYMPGHGSSPRGGSA